MRNLRNLKKGDKLTVRIAGEEFKTTLLTKYKGQAFVTSPDATEEQVEELLDFPAMHIVEQIYPVDLDEFVVVWETVQGGKFETCLGYQVNVQNVERN